MTAHTFPTDHTLPPNPDDPGRPGLVRAIATVGLVLGLLGLVLAPLGFSRLTGGDHPANLAWHSPEALWLLATSAGGTALSILLLVASAACMRLLAWGRRLMIVYAVAALVLGAVCALLYARWLGILGSSPHPINGAHGGVVGFIELMGWGLGIVFGLWALYGMTRPHGRDAFVHGPPVA